MTEKKTLITTPNINNADEFYAELIALQSDLDDHSAQSAYSALILLLANHIGDEGVLKEAFAIVRKQFDEQKG